ncbi:ethanolamine kinase 1 [Osmerus mordax]|uniref:ethanolamine kinase 1 n=1 Tax=Osmerus mordax TaxID=8014 RepID=UPI00350FD647
MNSYFKSTGQLLHLDVCVSEQTPHNGVLELLRRIRPQWKQEEIKLKVFTEGITNQLMGCFVDSLQDAGAVLVRVYGRRTELYVDRDREVDMFKLLHAHNCGPQIYCSFQNGICYEFVIGTVLDDTLLRTPAIYRLIASEMGKIHSIKPDWESPVEPVLWKRMSQFLQLVQNTKSDGREGFTILQDVPSIEQLSSEIESLKTHLSNINSPIVLCHNDLLTKNIIYDHKMDIVRFIDYEYADYNYQAFDIGNHFNEFAGVKNVDCSLYPSWDLQRNWLTSYLESYKPNTQQNVPVTETEVTELYIQVCKFSLASNFIWGLWAILQARYSSIDFDFQGYAKARFNFYFEKKEEYFRLTFKN